MDIVFQFTKKRANFGKQPMFSEQGPEMCDSISTNVSEHRQYILRNPVHKQNQNTPNFSEHAVNTIRAEYTSTGINHAEGGWAKDININDPEMTQRYRRKIEKDDAYIHCVMTLAPDTEHYIMQNNAIDMYQTYFAELRTQPPLERTSVRIVNVYRDPHSRPVTSISWQPDGGHEFAVTYTDMDFYYQPSKPTSCYTWDTENPLEPCVTLEPPCPMLDLQYSPREPSILAGGLVNGKVAQFDARTGGAPVQTIPSHVAHRSMARNVLFLNSKSGMEFFSGGMEGVCKWWDLRNLQAPTDEMIIDVCTYSFDVQTIQKAHGISVLEYEPTIPTRFMVGSENGHVICGNRKGKSPLEKLPAVFENAHLGPVYCLERNPGFMKNFLTIGDWCARIWSEDCRDSPIMWTPMHRRRLRSGTWSPTRLSLMALTGNDGKLALWDILRKIHEPVVTIKICPDPLLKACFEEKGALCATGSQRGRIYMVELSNSLQQTGYKDKALLTAMFERETKRERILEARLREIKLKRRQAEEGEPHMSTAEMEMTIGDRDLAEATAEYVATVKRELTMI